MQTFKGLTDNFNLIYNRIQANNKKANHGECDHKPAPRWADLIILPIAEELARLLNLTLREDSLNSYGLRSHVPVSLYNQNNECIFLDFEHTFSDGSVFLTDFSVPDNKSYRPGTIGQINGFGLTRIKFEADNTAQHIADFIKANPEKFPFTKD